MSETLTAVFLMFVALETGVENGFSAEARRDAKGLEFSMDLLDNGMFLEIVLEGRKASRNRTQRNLDDDERTIGSR